MTEEERFNRILATRSIVDWPYSTVILYSNDSGHNQGEVDIWLREHVGERRIAWAVDYLNQGVRYKFKTSEHKILFTLTWA